MIRPDDYSGPIDELSEEQIESWRGILSLTNLGSYAFTMPVEQIIWVRNRAQELINKHNNENRQEMETESDD